MLTFEEIFFCGYEYGYNAILSPLNLSWMNKMAFCHGMIAGRLYWLANNT